MPRSLCPLLACALVLAVNFCSPVRGQDSPAPPPAPSLGDVARQTQAQKDKDKNKSNPSAKKVFTNDDFPSVAGSGSSSTNPGAAHVVQPVGQPAGQSGAPDKPAAAAPANPADQLAQMGSLLGQLDSLDRATLAKNVLQGNEANFPGRAAWEEKLFAAKQLFVAQEREILTKASQFAASSTGIPDMQNANDPRAKALSDQLDQLMQEAQRSSAAFQAVVAEGKELAGQSPAH